MQRIAAAFHVEHKRLYGYSLDEENAPIELINVRLRAVGHTEKPSVVEEPYAGKDAGPARKGNRTIYIPEDRTFARAAVYDGHKTRHGYHIAGPALIEQVNTTLLVSAAYDCLCDKYGSFVVFQKSFAGRLPRPLRELMP